MSIRNASNAAPSTLSPALSGAAGPTPRWNVARSVSRLGAFAALCIGTQFAHAAPFAYVTNYADSTVSVIDTATNAVVSTITVGLNPLGIALSPAGDRVYVTNFGSGSVATTTAAAVPSTVSVIDTNSNTVIATVPVGFEPQLIALNPAGTFAYVANLNSASVSVINTATNAVSATVTVGNFPVGVAVNSAGTFAYVTTVGSGLLAIIDTATNTVTANIPVGGNPLGVALNPAGTRAYVANYNTNDVWVIDTAAKTVVAKVAVGYQPDGIAVDPAGAFAYVTNFGDNTISIIDTATNTVTSTITGIDPLGISINATGTLAYIANFSDGSVSVLDTATKTFVATIKVGVGAGFNAVGGLVNLNQNGLTGTWYNPTKSGQGFDFDFYPDANGAGHGQLFGGWFTYDTTAAGGQRWYSLGGDVSNSGAPASLKIYASYGGNFAAPPVVGSTQVGTATLAFADCTHATLGYNFTDGSARVGTIPLTRLTVNTTCATSGNSTNPPLNYLLSGAWYDPSASGQGLLFDINPAQKVLFAGWFTYALNGAQIGGPASQSWYTLQSNAFVPGTTSIANVGIYATTGGAFNSAVPTPAQAQVGTANIKFNSCNSMTLGYNFTSGSNLGKTGTINLVRVGPTPAGCSL